MDENQETQENQNNVGEAFSLDAIKTQLADEQTARAALETSGAEKDARILALETELSEAKTASESRNTQLANSAAELATVTAARDAAVSKYLGMAKALNPAIPEHLIQGATVEAIDQSIEDGKVIVEAVKTAMAAEAANAKVPAGAPPRASISTEGMSPREKIAYGIQQKGGSS